MAVDLPFRNPFFVGIAGVGMSALAQYLKGIGLHVSGSDRFFTTDQPNKTRQLLEKEGIFCYPQDGQGLSPQHDVLIISSAIEDTVPEVVKARELGIPIMKRSELLSLVSRTKKTIAVAGTSGKSSTAAMLFHILQVAGLHPSIISGAGLTALIKQGHLGNCFVGSGEYLVIEADESDGSVVQYHPEIGLLLNIDKDHQEMDELMELFRTFREHTHGKFIVNQSQEAARQLSVCAADDFGYQSPTAGYSVENFTQEGTHITFQIKNQPFSLPSLGQHSAENAAAAVAVAHSVGVSLELCARALADYEGIYRRHQILGEKNGVIVIDDYAHNPAKCAASIRACQPLADKVIAWFQPHGYAPTRFLRMDFVKEIAAALRPQDEIWMSEIYYAGGSTVKDISAADLISDLRAAGAHAFFVERREDFLAQVRPHIQTGSKTVLLLMGARDPSLEEFGQNIYTNI